MQSSFHPASPLFPPRFTTPSAHRCLSGHKHAISQIISQFLRLIHRRIFHKQCKPSSTFRGYTTVSQAQVYLSAGGQAPRHQDSKKITLFFFKTTKISSSIDRKPSLRCPQIFRGARAVTQELTKRGNVSGYLGEQRGYPEPQAHQIKEN